MRPELIFECLPLFWASFLTFRLHDCTLIYWIALTVNANVCIACDKHRLSNLQYPKQTNLDEEHEIKKQQTLIDEPGTVHFLLSHTGTSFGKAFFLKSIAPIMGRRGIFLIYNNQKALVYCYPPVLLEYKKHCQWVDHLMP